MPIEIEYCPECGTKNYVVDDADPYDCSIGDVSHYICHKCKKKIIPQATREYLEHCDEWEKPFFTEEDRIVEGVAKLE